MVNRRHIRVKVMQSVYAFLQSKSDGLDKEEKFLYNSIDKIFDLYALVLYLLVEVRNLEKKHIEISQKKFLATPEELKPNTKFVENQIFQLLSESVSLNKYIETNKLNYWKLDNEYVHEILKLTKKSKSYSSYMSSEKSSFQEDKEFMVALFKEIIAPNEKLADYFEDKNISWVDDIPFVNTWVVKTLNQMKANQSFRLGNLYKNDDDEKFVVDLFRKVVLNHVEFEKEVIDKTPNWDTDRIAEIDM